jgi:hypothetical protein
MTRQLLLDIAARWVAWGNSRTADPETLSKIIARDAVFPVPYSSATSDFEGIVKMAEGGRTASPDDKMTIDKAIVDEVESTVVHLVEVTGTHNTYFIPKSPLILVRGSEFQRLCKS